MSAVDDPGRRRSPTFVVVAALALISVLGLVVIAIGLGGAFGATPSRVPTALPTAPSSTPGATPSPSPNTSLPVGSAITSASGSVRASGIARASGSASAAPIVDDPLLQGLLAETDLPGLASPLGPQEGTDYDIDTAAFEANDGIRVASRTWQSLADTGFAAVFDFRMQFPTDAAAAAYLAAAEPVLSEATATGQSPIPSPPVVGADTRVYGLEQAGVGGNVLLRTYLFRVGSVVAKVVAGGVGVDAATADALAATAAARIVAAGPSVPGSPRPVAAPTPTPVPTTPLPTGEALAARLLEHVPPEFGSGCVPDAQRLWPGELATLVCTDDASGVTVTYSGFDGADSLEAAFDAALSTISLDQVAASCDQGPYVGDYQLEGEPIGRVVCWPEQGGQALMWSDDRLAILAVAVSPTLDPAGLYLWWLGAGPVP